MHRFWRANIISIILMCGLAPYAQGQSIDSLWQALEQTASPGDRFDLLSELSSRYVYNQPDSALLLLKEASALRTADISLRQLALYHRRRSLAYKQQSNYNEALLSIDSSLLLFREVGDSTEVAKALVNKGTYFQQLDQLDEAFNYFQQGRKLLEEAEGEALAKAKVINNLSVIYISWGMHAEAIALLFEAIEIKERLQDYGSLANSYGTLASLYMAREDPDQALEYHKKALQAAKKSDNQYLEAVFLFNIGSNYKDLESYERAETFMREARVIATDINNSLLLGYCAVGLAEVDKERGQLEAARRQLENSMELDAIGNSAYMRSNVNLQLAEIAMEQGRLREAEQLGLEALSLAKRIPELPFVSQGEELLARVYEEMGDASTALSHYKAYKSAQDSILSHRNSERINKLQAQYDHQLEQKDYALQLVEAEKQRDRAANQAQRWYALFVTLALLVLGGIVAALLYLNRKQRHSQEELNSMNEELYTSNEQLEIAYLDTVSNKQQLEIANQNLQQFVRAISDGVNDQVSQIRSSSTMLRDQLDDNELTDEARQHLRQIADHSLRTEYLIKDLLRYYRLESEKPNTQCSTPLDAVAKEARARILARESVQNVTVSIENSLPAVAMAPMHAEQLIETLLMGVAQLCDTKKPCAVFLGKEACDSGTVFSVKADLKQLSGEQLKTLFQPFPLPREHNALCSGMELALSNRIVQMYGGKIWQEEARFCFTLPLSSTANSNAYHTPEKENL